MENTIEGTNVYVEWVWVSNSRKGPYLFRWRINGTKLIFDKMFAKDELPTIKDIGNYQKWRYVYDYDKNKPHGKQLIGKLCSVSNVDYASAESESDPNNILLIAGYSRLEKQYITSGGYHYKYACLADV